jgi:iron complex transport system ATP-binding protein
VPPLAHAERWLQCRDVGVAPPGQPVLAWASGALAPGRVTAILGPNGAGKSTLLGLLAGLAEPAHGQVLLQGRVVTDHAPEHIARWRAVMPQDTAVAFDFTVREVVDMGRYPHRRQPSAHEAQVVDAAMQATGVAHLAARSVTTLSGGERARTHLARALAQIWEPVPEAPHRWLLLDEPTAALDLAHQHQTLRLLRRWAVQQGVGVVVVLHDLNLALRYAHDAVLLAQGGALFGQVDEVVTPATVQRVWGVGCTAVHMADGTRQMLMVGAEETMV